MKRENTENQVYFIISVNVGVSTLNNVTKSQF
jgi:hypothetical protein